MSVIRVQSVDVFEQLNDFLHAIHALHQAGGDIGFAASDQAEHVDDAVLGDDLDP